MAKFIKTKQRQQRLERVIKGYNETIRRAAARKAYGHMAKVVLPKLENANKLLNKIKTSDEYEELINRLLETKRAVYEEKTIQLGEYTTIETQTTRQIKKQQQRSIQAFIQNETPAKIKFQSDKKLKDFISEYQFETFESFRESNAKIFKENVVIALLALSFLDLVKKWNHLNLIQIDSICRMWPEAVEALWAAYESHDPVQIQEAYDRMATAINNVKGKQ